MSIQCGDNGSSTGGAATKKNSSASWDYKPVQLKNPPSGTKVIWGEGFAEIRASGKADARDRAIEKAKRDCIERVLGFYISSETIAESGMMIAEETFKRSAGMVKDYAVLEENERSDLEAMYVKIEGAVDVQPTEEAIKQSTEEIIAKMKYPVVVVINYEAIDGKVDNSGEGIAGPQLVQKFKEKGYTVKDITSANKAERIKLMKALKDNNKMAVRDASISVGRSLGARMVVAVNTTVNDVGNVSYGGNTFDLNSYQALINVTVILADNGEILGTLQKEGRIADKDPNIGASKAITRALVDAGGFEDLNTQILDDWMLIKTKGMWIDLYITAGIDVLSAKDAADDVRNSFSECTECNVEGKTDKGILLRTRWRFGGNGFDLAHALRDKADRFPYKVTLGNFTPGEVYCSLKKKGK